MSAPEVSAVQNGCHNGNVLSEVVSTPPAQESPSSASPAKNPISQNQVDVSPPSKKDTETNGNAQTITSNNSDDHSCNGRENAPVTVPEVQNGNPCSKPEAVSSLNATSAPPMPEPISKSCKSETTSSGRDVVVDKSKESQSSSEKQEAKSSSSKSKAKKSESETKKSKKDKSGKSSAMKESASDVVGKVNGQSSKPKRKRKQSETSDADQEVRLGKRVRLPHMPFQHPAAQQIPQYFKNSFSNHKNSSKESTDDKIVVFNRGDFLAVRNDCDSFYICRTTQNVYKTSRKFKIQWLQNEKNKDLYKLDFLDQTDFECVLTNVRLNRQQKGEYDLPADEKQRILNILQRAINVERGVTDVPDLKQVAADGIDVSIVGKKEEKELLQLESLTKKDPPPAESSSKSKVEKSESVKKSSSRLRKMSTESSRSSRKSEASQKENLKKRPKSEPKKEVPVEKPKKREVRDESDSKRKKIREKRSSASTSSTSQPSSAKSKDQVLVEKIVGEIVKKHKIEQSEKELKKKKKKKKANKELKSDKKEEKHRTSRLTRNTAAAAAAVAPAPAASLAKPSPPHHETIRGLVNLLNTWSSSSLRNSTFNLLEKLAHDYPKDCLPFLVETLITGHRAFVENDDGFIAGPYFPRKHGKDTPPKSKAPKSLFQMYFHQKMLSVKLGSDKEYDRSVTDFYSGYYAFIVTVCRIGIQSDFVSGDLVSLCSTVALESLPTGVPVFVSFWKELIDAEERGQESQFLEVLGHCPNFRNYVIAILNQERKFLAHDSNFELAKRLASKVKTMSSLTQKLVSSRSLTLISDILKDYPSVEAVKDPQVFVTVLRALNLSLLYTSTFDPKTMPSEKVLVLLKSLKDKYSTSLCNGESEAAGGAQKESADGDDKGKGKSNESRTGNSANKISECIHSILQLLDVPK